MKILPNKPDQRDCGKKPYLSTFRQGPRDNQVLSDRRMKADVGFTTDGISSSDRTSRRSVLGLFLGVSAGFAGCMPVRRDRIRLTATVEVDGQTYTGSSVQLYTNYKGSNAFHGMAMGGSKVNGEAVVISLGRRGYLFMILCGADDFQVSGLISRVLLARKADETKWSLDPSRLPRFVAFTNPQVSSTVFNVSPGSLDKFFGSGAKLLDVTAEYTSDPITRGEVSLVLPWLAAPNAAPGIYLTGKTGQFGNTFADQLQYYHFTGFDK